MIEIRLLHNVEVHRRKKWVEKVRIMKVGLYSYLKRLSEFVTDQKCESSCNTFKYLTYKIVKNLWRTLKSYATR